MKRIKRIFKKLSMVQKFSAAVFVLILAIMIIVSVLIINHQRRVLRAEMYNNHIVIVTNLAKDSLDPLILKDPLRLDELVRIIAQTPECVYAGIISQDKRIVAHTDRRLLGKTLSGNVPDLFSARVTGDGKYIRDISEDGIKEIMVPVKAGYESVGMAFAGFSRTSIDGVIENNLRGLKHYIVLVSAGVMLAGIWGAFGLARFLTTPMKRLRDKMELVQTGNLDVEVANDYSVNCWDVLGCEARECPAYGKKRCWTIPGTFCFGKIQGEAFEKICECKNCIVYKESCGDEIGELIEVFNQMIKRLQENVRALEETGKEKTRLEKLSALGEMSMTVAHEIKNPLNAIRGAVSYLKENFGGEVLREFLEIIDEETKRLNEIVTSILRYSRPVPLNLQVSSINKVIRDTAELVRHEATDNNVEVLMSLDESIPDFKFDTQQLKQALLNILVNSLDVTKAGGAVRITTETFDSRVLIVIKDSGTGMSEETIAEIFKPFFTTKTRGSGLGLACVERIVKDHKGEIAVKSEIGKGTEFTIALPLWN